MKRENLPDDGAYIEVHTRHAGKFNGYIHPGHVWVEGAPVLCLASEPYTPDSTFEVKYDYVLIEDISAWTWDCRN